METFEIILVIIIAAMALAMYHLMSERKKFLDKVVRQQISEQDEKEARLGKNPPYVDLGLDTEQGYMEDHCQRSLEFISRHWIAEHDAKCPRCIVNTVDTVVAEHGDYTNVSWTWVNNGAQRFQNECIYCEECHNWLLASPDTEHNDHLEDDKPEHHFFIRKHDSDVIREKYGDDALDRDAQAVYVKADGDRKAVFDKPAIAANSVDDKPLPHITKE